MVYVDVCSHGLTHNVRGCERGMSASDGRRRAGVSFSFGSIPSHRLIFAYDERRGEEKTPSATAAALIVLADSESLLNGIDRPDHLS